MADKKTTAKSEDASAIEMTTTVLIIVLLVELVAMGAYSASVVEEKLEADNIVAQAEKAIEKNYPSARKEILNEIEENAPEIASLVSQRLVHSGPELRSVVEAATEKALETGLDEATEFSKQKFEEFINERFE